MNHLKRKTPVAFLILIVIIFTSCTQKSPTHYFKNASAKFSLKDYNGAITDINQALKLKIKQPVKVKAHQDPAVFNKIKRYTQEIETLHLQYSEQKYKGIQQALTTLLQDMQVQEERQHTLRQVKSSALTVVGEKYNQQKQFLNSTMVSE